MKQSRRSVQVALGVTALVLFVTQAWSQPGAAPPACTIEACALWSDGFTLLRGAPGKPLRWTELEASVAARAELVPLARRYFDTREGEERAHATIWTVGTFVPFAWTATWLVKSLSALGGEGSEDESSRLRREFLVAAGGMADPEASAPSPAGPRFVLSQRSVIEARTGRRVAAMRPLWSSVEPIRPLLGGNAEALKWFAKAKSAQTQHRISATILPISWASMFMGFAMAFAGGGDEATVAGLFWGGLAGTVTSFTVKVNSEREVRRSVGRALLYTSPP